MKTEKNKVNQKNLKPINATKPAAPPVEPPAAIGVPEETEAPESLPPVEDVEPQVEPEKAEKPEGEKKDGRGRPQGMICSFPLTVGEILAESPELKSMWHVVSEKQPRTSAEIQALIAERVAAGLSLADPEFLGSLAAKEIGENLQLQGRKNDKGEMVNGYLEKYGPEFKITVTRGQVKKYFDDRAAGVFARLTAKIAAREAAAAAAVEGATE